MKRWLKETWLATVLLAAVMMLVLTVLIVTVVDALAADVLPTSGISWSVDLQRAEAALAAGDVAAALRHWRDAHAAALGTRRWEGLVEAGDLFRRIGARAGFHAAAVARARDCYLTALLRARGEGSLDGVLRATEAFIDLGDAPVVERSLEIARGVAAHDVDPRAQARVDLMAGRWAARSAAARDGAFTAAGSVR